jgi:predicted Rossmann fold flavoprotein
VSRLRIIVVGGGAAGFFAAIAAAEANPDALVKVLEKGRSYLAKVKVSGGGRCNVTHSCFDPREFSQRYPRGGRELIGPFNRFQAHDTVEWFESRGVKLKAEKDGRMFPVTDASQTIIDCLMDACRNSGVTLSPDTEVRDVAPQPDGSFSLTLKNDETLPCDRLLFATGGVRSTELQNVFKRLGHHVEPPVPSLFTFHIEVPWLRELAGVSVPEAGVSVVGSRLKERGPILLTHWGLSGPAILKLSAWGARELNDCQYKFTLLVDWLPSTSESAIKEEITQRRNTQSAKPVVKIPLPPIPTRLWEQIVAAAGINSTTRWSELSGAQQHELIQRLKRTEFPVTGKSMNKEEFVTCGGIRLSEVNFKTMESRIVSHLHFAGEALDIDGITGGFNFQAAWTTGWIAGKSMAEE